MAKKRREDIIYDQLFGHLPNTQIERIGHILGNKVNNKKYNDMIAKEARRMKNIKSSKITFTMWKIVKPSQRPRTTSIGGFNRIYVPHARENADWFADFCKENNLPFIDTPCTVNLKVYEKTPSSFSIKNKVLAELGLIRPWKRTGDVDNYAKGVLDAIQHGMLKDDCLVIDSRQELYYSIKPHAVIEIIYMNKFPQY